MVQAIGKGRKTRSINEIQMNLDQTQHLRTAHQKGGARMSFSHLEDIHCHSGLSSCSSDPAMTPQLMLEFAEKHEYRMFCLTDHLWDAAIPGSSKWYAPQDIEHVMRSLPLPQGKVPFFFGCETELPANGIPALARDHFDLFDFVVIPPNHMHMEGLVRPTGIDTPQQMARLIEDRLENLLTQDLPFQKIGIAHLICSLMFREGSSVDVVKAMDEKRLMRIFDGYARAGAGIELNASDFRTLDDHPEDSLRIFRIARAAGCKFYCASDAHSPDSLSRVPDILPRIIDLLGLTEEDRYAIPALVR